MRRCCRSPHTLICLMPRCGGREGGLENEVLIQFEFAIDQSVEGLQSLEFLAWFVRDYARGGKKIQLRPFALPPETPYARHWGRR
ncbi:hypothetical protein M5W83_14540 [Paenibacillus thiaminolyticus]|uniref:Uncharacterized protein n=1 Tax=Paenibacillus thiaminolyticus TaxID=49283 RepID=A0ABT4FW25_PANTH|nr:hypothetical protein [Paenibacillus thiaminolyticus]MCY9537211.1 hypothetical protein [Paenibacillus thiaminolyticus]MCY9600622.1 hypothetical protein [Paenibacillus thiaminolyticus]MCY9608364.1 hypothetical protein [Paenibacillus thiaminolyticus]MCY9614773.1 hypothetical protein [Paenibacillus thiaminolyticus]MCY9619935.1 hypothetical protein [Paenibacillus thiaminolyticus]